MKSLTQLGWPASSADSEKYNNVAESIDKSLNRSWGEYVLHRLTYSLCSVSGGGGGVGGGGGRGGEGGMAL